MNQDEILDKLGASIEAYDIDEAEKYARLAMDEGISPDDAINLGLAKGMDTISRLFDEAKIFLPQILMAAKAMEAALDIIEPYMKKGDDVKLKGVIVMGSVKGDIHEIGKNVCCAMLRGAGFKVIDLGTDVSPYAFEKAIEESNADVVGGSALMTTSLYQQKDMVRVFNEDKLPVITIFGGAPCSEEWVNEIGGDGYSASGSEIVELVRRLLSEKPWFLVRSGHHLQTDHSGHCDQKEQDHSECDRLQTQDGGYDDGQDDAEAHPHGVGRADADAALHRNRKAQHTEQKRYEDYDVPQDVGHPLGVIQAYGPSDLEHPSEDDQEPGHPWTDVEFHFRHLQMSDGYRQFRSRSR